MATRLISKLVDGAAPAAVKANINPASKNKLCMHEKKYALSRCFMCVSAWRNRRRVLGMEYYLIGWAKKNAAKLLAAVFILTILAITVLAKDRRAQYVD
jgi:hypothetical protein